MTSSSLEVGRRYLHAKTRQPLTLLYIGPLPPLASSSNSFASSSTSSSSTTSQWLGVEYDDPSQGKGHSGIYEGVQVFHTRQEGAGAFIRLRTGLELLEGRTFIQAFRDRYGLDQDEQEGAGEGGSVVLGSSGSAIVVEAPGMEGVSRRLRNLERLKQIGLEDELVCGVGGTEDQKVEMRARLGGVTLLNISRSLLTDWKDVGEIISLLPRLDTVVLKLGSVDATRTDLQPLRQLKEFHLARCMVTWSDLPMLTSELCALGPAMAGLEGLHLSETPHILRGPPVYPALRGFENLRVLDLSECGIVSFDEVEGAFGHLENLESINLTANPLGQIDPPESANAKRPFAGLRSLILLSTHVRDFDSLANLSARLPDLTALLFGLDPAVLAINQPGRDVKDEKLLSGDVDLDHGILIALFPRMQVLNGTAVRGKDRDEAERRFTNTLTLRTTRPKVASGTALQRIVESLAKKHDLQVTPTLPAPAIQPTSLRSKMIKQKEGFTISLLPSSPIPLLKRKIGKKAGLSVEGMKVWTVRRSARDGGGEDEEVWAREKVAEVNEGEVGYWFQGGDGVIVQLG